MTPARRLMASIARLFAILTAVAAAVTLRGIDGAAWKVAAWAAVVLVIYGGLYYAREVRRELPLGEVLELPPGVEVRYAARRGRVLLGLVAFALAVAAAARLAGLGPGIAIGEFGGMAVANAVGALRVGRWERRHGARLLVPPGGEGLCYRAHPLQLAR